MVTVKVTGYGDRCWSSTEASGVEAVARCCGNARRSCCLLFRLLLPLLLISCDVMASEASPRPHHHPRPSPPPPRERDPNADDSSGSRDFAPDDVSRVTPVKRRRLLPLVDLRGGGMAGSSVELGGRGSGVGGSLGPGRRSRTPLTDLDAKFVAKVSWSCSFEVVFEVAVEVVV
ncbi:uncharacterized protein LOC125038074 [Penaeus chinensis]|uniref:uncharacterized protein LOC125038074 n=1 Tax=Penaeus chinensis TaxID=139456 RepID=UPI001FB66D62|nr:uncharacterized protein LOC125038074 [Penaeus chinensis]